MIDALPVIMAAAAVTYLTRIAGFGLVGRQIPPAVDRFLFMIPVAAFAALTVPDLLTGTAPPLRVVAALAAAGLTLTTRKVWLGILAGMVVFFALRAFGF